MQNTRLSKLLDFLTQDPNDSFILYALATEYNTMGNFDQALAYYNQLVNEHPAYVGTYYHLGKLLEKQCEKNAAILIYKKGMVAARAKRDMHALSELQGAYNAATGLDFEDD